MHIEFKKLRLSASLILLLSLGACGGNDSNAQANGAPTDDEGAASGNDPYPDLAINGQLNGVVFETEESRYIDTETGEIISLSADAVYPSADGRYFVEHRESARFMPDAGCYDFAKWFDRISIRDSVSGRVTDEFELSENVYGPIKLSPDGQTMAFFWNKSHTCYDEENAVTLFSRSGEEIIRASSAVGSYDWLPDNRLAFTLGQKIAVETERNTLNYRTVVDLSDVKGYPGRIDVSPDGSRILFEMITRTSLWNSTVHYRDATVWAVNVDGTGLRQVATTSREDDPDSDYDDPQVNMPVWSPDNQSLIATEDYTSGGIFSTDFLYNVDAIPITNSALTYVMPADSAVQKLPPEQYSGDGVRPLLARGSGGNFALVLDPLSPIMWAPPYARPEVVPGSLPAANGQPNRGLSGAMTFLKEEDNGSTSLVSVDLASATPRTITTLTDRELDSPDLSAVAADNSRTAHYKYDYGDDSLRVYDKEGVLFRDVALITNSYDYSPETAFQFSPVDNNLITWIYDDGDFGTGAIVLNVETMTFVAEWENRDYDIMTWTPEGDLLVIDEGQVFLSRVAGANAGDFSELEYLFDFGERMDLPAVNPVTREIAFSAAGQIFVIGMDGQNARRVVSNSDGLSYKPVWSPDGKFMTVLHRGSNYIVAADARDVRLYTNNRSMGGFELGEGSTYTQPQDSRRLSWQASQD